jgi:hypothetical protein
MSESAPKKTAAEKTPATAEKTGWSHLEPYQWKKGAPSPNPAGRPKSRLVSEALKGRLAEVDPNDPKGRTRAELIAEKLEELALAGDVQAVKEIVNRIEGLPRQDLAVTATALSMSPERANALVARLFQLQAERQGLRLVDESGAVVDPAKLLPPVEDPE